MKKVAILIDDMFEDAEFIYPYYRLIEAGISVEVVARKKSLYRGKHGTAAKATHAVHELKREEYDGVYIPGGYAPDRLRTDSDMVEFVKFLFEEGKAVCAVCHGPSLLISAGILKGKNATGYHSIKDDIKNAGADYTAKSVERDGNIITAQDPKSLPEMMKLFLSLLKK